jgi:hypothetical protein
MEAGWPRSYEATGPGPSLVYSPSCREEVFSETGSPHLCSALHEYSACTTSGGKTK